METLTAVMGHHSRVTQHMSRLPEVHGFLGTGTPLSIEGWTKGFQWGEKQKSYKQLLKTQK